MIDVAVFPHNEKECKKLIQFLDKNSYDYQDAQEYLEENRLYTECDCEEEMEPQLLVDQMKEDLWMEVRDKFTIDELEALLK